jgi:four helix bundle protein
MTEGQMEPGEKKLAGRMFEFAVVIVRVTSSLPRSTVGRNIANQLFRAGTSGPANYEEACAVESRADFIHKMQIVLKEMREARFWLRLIARTSLLPDDVITPVLRESQELCNMVGRSVVTAKRQS